VLGGAAMLPLRHILELLELQAKSLESARKSSPAASSEGREDSEAGSGSNGEESATGAAVPVVLLSIGAVNHALRQLSAHMQTADFFPVVLSRDRKMRIITLLLRLFDATHPLPWERPTQAKGTRSSSRLKSRHLAEQSQTANSSSRLCDLALNPKVEALQYYDSSSCFYLSRILRFPSIRWRPLVRVNHCLNCSLRD